jgi:hypothetical protein
MSQPVFDEEKYLILALAPYCAAEAVLDGVAGWHTFLESRVRVPVGVVNAYRDMILAPARLYVERLDARVRWLWASASANSEDVAMAELKAEASRLRLEADENFYRQLVEKFHAQRRARHPVEWF